MKSEDPRSEVLSNIHSEAQIAIDNKTKPPGSLGLLEATAVQLATIQNTLRPSVDPARVIVYGGRRCVPDTHFTQGNASLPIL